jgi:predicted permease
MRWHRRLKSMLAWLFRRHHAEADLEDELRDHMQLEIESNLRAGMSPEEARFAAQRLVGSVALYKEECRDARGIGFLETLAPDLRYAVRMLRRTPVFTAAAILTLALGIGANTTVFTFIDNILWRSFPARDPQQLLSVNWNGMINVSYPNYVDFRDRNRVFSDLIASRFNPVNVSLRARQNFRVWGYEATGNYFQALGISPELGRFFTPQEDDKPGANPVVVISDRYWRTRFASDPRAVGSRVRINGYPFTIIGVAPPSFLGTELILAGDYWVPMSMESQIEPGFDWLRNRGSGAVWTIGRLKAGVSRAQAEADLARIARQLARIYPNEVEPRPVFKLPRPGLIGTYFRGPITAFGLAFMAIAGAALLLACINLAGMLLARASDRHREIGIRLAVGASRFQLLRQLMTESLLLALSGGVAGLAIAFAACHLFSSWRIGADLAVNPGLHPDGVVLSFALAVAVLTTLLFGLVPALQTVRTELIPSLKDEPISARVRRVSLRDLLVVGQIALSIVLVISSVLVVRSLQHALAMNLGFDPNQAVAVSFDLQLAGYDRARSRRLDADLLQKASTIPGLQSVAIVNNLPLRAGENDGVFSRGDRPMPPRSEWRSANIYNVSPRYFQTARTRLLSGRDFTAQDREGAPHVLIVNQALAQLLYPRENPIGKQLRLGTPPHEYKFQIVGVVETGKYDSLGEDPKPVLYMPIAQSQTQMTTLIARTSLAPEQATELLRKAVLDLDPELTIFNAGSLKDQLAMPLFPAQAAAIVLGAFGVLAMVLAATGLFALVAYSVARRMREIGIRMALGARSAQVLSSVLLRTVVLCGAGIVLGTVVTLAAGRLLSAILYGVSPRDPITYATAVVVMAAVALGACWNPAARAIHVDPARTLREQ